MGSPALPFGFPQKWRPTKAFFLPRIPLFDETKTRGVFGPDRYKAAFALKSSYGLDASNPRSERRFAVDTFSSSEMDTNPISIACTLAAWKVPIERLEAVVPELPFGITDQPFEAVNLCVDAGRVIGAARLEDARAAANEVLAVVAHYRHFFWGRRGVGTNVVVYWSSAGIPDWAGPGLSLAREILRAVPCVYTVDAGGASTGAVPLWVARSERFGAATGTPTIILSSASDVDMCAAGDASPRDMIYVLTMEGDGARFLACASDAPDAATDAAVACIEAQFADEGDPDAVAALIAERLGPADVPVGHLFDGVDQWG